MADRIPQDRSEAPTALMTTTQAAGYLGLGLRTLQNWRVRGVGPRFVRCGRAVRYSQNDLREYLDARRFSSTSEADHMER